MSKKTVDLYSKANTNKHRLDTFLTVLKGYLQGALAVCDSVENNKNLFPTWNDNVTTYITAALDLIYEMENCNGNKHK